VGLAGKHITATLAGAASASAGRLAMARRWLRADERPGQWGPSALRGYSLQPRQFPYSVRQLAESPLTERLFRESVRRIERLAWYPTW